MVNDKSNLTGSDVALIAAVTNRFSFSMMARPEFKRVSDLKGKRIGVTRVGSSTHTVALYALNQAGLKPGDYEILPLAEVPNILVALMAGQDRRRPAVVADDHSRAQSRHGRAGRVGKGRTRVRLGRRRRHSRLYQSE